MSGLCDSMDIKFCNNELMVWATVHSRFSFCQLYRASPLSTAKNIINLILELTIWWCQCVELSLVYWERVFAMTNAFSWQNPVSLCPASFCTPRSNLAVTPAISCLNSWILFLATLSIVFLDVAGAFPSFSNCLSDPSLDNQQVCQFF